MIDPTIPTLMAPSMTFSTERRAGLEPAESARRAHAALRVGEVGHRVAAFYLADLVDRNGHKELGYGSLREFARKYLRTPESTVRKLVGVGRALERLPVIDASFAAGRITWTHVKALVTVATPQTDQAWAEWAAKRSTTAIERQVTKYNKGDLPTDPTKRRIHEPRQRAGADFTPTSYAEWRQARAKLRAITGAPVSDKQMMSFVGRLILSMRPDGSIPGWAPVNDRHYMIHAYPRHEGSTELVTFGEDGQEIEVDLAELTAPLLAPAPSSEATEAAWKALEAKELELARLDPANHGAVVPDIERDAPTTPALREEILIRDGYRCRLCCSKDNLTVHHRTWRRFGGKTVRGNLLALCEPCHSLVHARLLIVLGDPEGELRFLDRTGRPTNQPAPAQPVDLPLVGVSPAPVQVQLEHLPAELDAEGWVRHQHLFEWNERQGELVFTPGHARQAEVEPQATPGPQDRPKLSGLVGQSAVRQRLEVSIAAARQRGEQLGHLVFTGGPGLGKTSLAHAVAGELGAPIVSLPAPQVRTPDVMVRALASLGAGSILFLDEVHALPARAAEVLYDALDRGTLDLPVREREGLRSRSLRLRLPPFTLIGATTAPDELPRPLLSRLRELRLEPYPHDELTTILDGAARHAGLELTPEGARRLAGASRDTPRRALSLLGVVRDEATVAGTTTADLAIVERALARESVDAAGLDHVERTYLRELEHAGGALGLGTLASRLGVSEQALRTIHEPYLVRRGLVRITPAGRVREEVREEAVA